MSQLRRISLVAASTAMAAVLAGCAGRAGYTATGTVYTEKGYYDDPYYDVQPTMVPVHQGVWVVEGRTHPVFYSSGAYWRYDGGTWYRSSYVDDGYVRVQGSIVPRPVLRVDRPRRYIRYRAPTRARVRVVPPTHVRGRVDVRRPYDDRDRVRVRQPRDRVRVRQPRDRRQRFERRDDRRYRRR